MSIPVRQIRASYDQRTIRVYQAYPDEIADSALDRGTFVSPPFKMERMTWIKPSFLWMMYRSGWGLKDKGQKRILAVDITRDGFEWALEHSCLSHLDPKSYSSAEEWEKIKAESPVRIQWDPERNLMMEPMQCRAIQIGLSQEAVRLYVNEWVVNISDVTELAMRVRSSVESDQLEEARALLPAEVEYMLPRQLILRCPYLC